MDQRGIPGFASRDCSRSLVWHNLTGEVADDDIHGRWLIGSLHDKGSFNNANGSKASCLAQVIASSLRNS